MTTTCSADRCFERLVWTLLLVFACGCQRSVSGPAADDSDTVWEAAYMHGDKVGYSETSTRHVQEGRREHLHIECRSVLGVHRFGDRNRFELRTTSVETPAGELLRFTATTEMGGAPSTIRGQVEGNELLLEAEVEGKKSTSRVPWQTGTKGFRGVEQSLERDPMKPGETRDLRIVTPLGGQMDVMQVRLTAGDFEDTKLQSETRKLQRIESTLTASNDKGSGIQGFIWVDETGQVLKSYVKYLEYVTYRTTQADALRAPESPKFDLGFDAIVKVDRPIENPYQTQRVRYQVELEGEDPSVMFPAGANQHVTATGPHTADIVVTAPDYGAREPENEKGTPASDQPGPDDSAPNNMLQSDDPAIVEMARQGRGKANDPLSQAMALEQFVHGTVSSKNFTRAFSSAAEVARSREGDCTEHAVLLAALARACGMPSRVAVGLVYVESSQGFGYHMWTEVFASGRWLPLDATLSRGGIGASYLKLGDSNLKGASTFTSLLSVVQVLGRLKIGVLESE